MVKLGGAMIDCWLGDGSVMVMGAHNWVQREGIGDLFWLCLGYWQWKRAVTWWGV